MRVTTHPGEILKEDFLVPLDMSARALAEAIGVPPNRITAIVNGTRSVTADTAIRLGRHFKTTPELWMNLQQAHDLSSALAAEPKAQKTSRAKRPSTATAAAERPRRHRAA